MPDILALRSPPFLSPSVAAALFESHWLYWIAILAAATIVIFVAQSRADTRLLKIGAAAAGLTLLWAATALLFTTPAERLYAVHAAMADAAAKGDAAVILSHMDPNFTMYNLDIRGNTTPEAAQEEIASRLKQLGIRQTHFTNYHVMMNSGDTATSDFVALTESENGLIKSQWQITWMDEMDSDWKLKDAALIKLQNQSISPGEVVQ